MNTVIRQQIEETKRGRRSVNKWEGERQVGGGREGETRLSNFRLFF